MTVFNHVPYEFFQTYLDLLLQRFEFQAVEQYTVTPAVASIHVALTMLISAWASHHAMRLQRSFGAAWSLLATMLLQGVIIFSMAVVLHPIVVLLLLLRSTPRALMVPVINATTHPHLDSGLRATFFSLQSFAGRLLFGATLFATSIFTSGLGALTPESLSTILIGYAVVLATVFVVLCASSRLVMRVRHSDNAMTFRKTD